MPTRPPTDHRRAAALLKRICTDRPARGPGPRTLIVAAHPDDETIAAGGVLGRLGDVAVVHLTDGAPRDPTYARHAGFDSPAAYAAARRAELRQALGLAGIGPDRLYRLGATDQEAARELPSLARQLARLLDTLRPELVLTHAYEGGHPDHDAAAFAVRAALALLARQSAPLPAAAEFPSYHARGDTTVFGRFLPGGPKPRVALLAPAEHARKRRMLDCFATQRAVLARFPTRTERFRPAPTYDFRRPPHPGRLLYESFGWGITGRDWRALARTASRALGLAPGPHASRLRRGEAHHRERRATKAPHAAPPRLHR